MLCNVPEITKSFKFSCSNFSLFLRNVQQIWKSRRQDARHQLGRVGNLENGCVLWMCDIVRGT